MKFSAPLKENHFALWNWLAKNPDRPKFEWPGWETMGRLRANIKGYCFLCIAFTFCADCPLVSCINGLYRRWVNEDDPAIRTALAIQIRDVWK